MVKVALHDLWFRKRRLAGMVSAVVIGVAFLAGTLVLGDTMRAGFGSLFAEANAGTDAIVRSTSRLTTDSVDQRGTLPPDLVDEVRALPGVAAAEPSVQGLGQIIGADGEPIGGNGPPTIAGNWVTDAGLNPWRLAEGRAPVAPGEVVIDRRAAKLGDFAVGDSTTVRVPQAVTAKVVGIATFGSADSLSGTTYTAFATAEAERLLLGGDAITAVLVRGEPGTSPRALAAAIDDDLPSGLRAVPGAELTAEQQADIESDFLGLFEALLLVFAVIALVVATFSINNAFSILVAQRSRESALLRAVGASRAQVLRAVLAEALVVGALASAVGVAVGVGLAAGLRLLLDAAGFTMPTGTLAIGAANMALAAAVGIGVTVLASVAPAVRSSRVPPLAAMRELDVDRAGRSRTRAVGGLLLGALAAATITVGATTETLALTGLGAAGLLVAMVVVGPVVAVVASRALGWPLARARGLVGSLAVRNASRNPRRTAGTASALMVGVAVVTLFTVFAASLKGSVDDATRSSFRGDLVIASDSFSGSGLDPSMAHEVAARPEVAVASGLGDGVAVIERGKRNLTIVDPRGLGRVLDLDVTSGALGALGADGVAVSVDFADDHGLAVGAPVGVEFGDGTTAMPTVRAVYADTSLVNAVLLPRDVWVAHATQPSDVAVLVTLRDGVGLEEGRRAVQAVADEFAAPDVETRAEYVESVAGQVDAFLGVVYALLALAILIALMGIANTLSLSIHERTRELGLLRAVGETRAQLRTMIRGESAVIAAFGTAGGIALGLALAFAVVETVRDGGTLTAFSVPGAQLLVVLVAGAAAGLLAGVRPARRAARLPVLDAIAGA